MTVALWIASIVTGYILVATIVEALGQLTGLCRELETPDGAFGAMWPVSITCLAVFVAIYVMAKSVWWVLIRFQSAISNGAAKVSTFTKRSKLPPARVVK